MTTSISSSNEKIVLNLIWKGPRELRHEDGTISHHILIMHFNQFSGQNTVRYASLAVDPYPFLEHISQPIPFGCLNSETGEIALPEKLRVSIQKVCALTISILCCTSKNWEAYQKASALCSLDEYVSMAKNTPAYSLELNPELPQAGLKGGESYSLIVTCDGRSVRAKLELN